MKLFLSLKRAIWSAVISLLLVIYAMNFVLRNVNILAERTLSRQIFDYILNFLIFFVVIYLLVFIIAIII
jgi:hypothetical protein